MKMNVKNKLRKIGSWISFREVRTYFIILAALYLFSLFGSLFGSTDFTYADF